MSKFELGQIVATHGALDVMQAAKVNPTQLIRKHESGDWGNVPATDAKANDKAISPEHQARVMSSYKVTSRVLGTKEVWIITEADRSVTTILLPEEY